MKEKVRQSEAKFNELKVGQQFRFSYEPYGTIRTVTQVGRTEVYCPKDNAAGGKNEVYAKSDKTVILLTPIKLQP